MIPLPLPPKIIEKDKEGKKAIFEIESLYPGYGSTVGNSFRRVLLSSLEGAAITQIKVEGVQHEFSTIEGVMEDMITIILNLKQLNFKMFSDEPQKATLSVKGEKEVKAKDFKFPTQVEIINSDAPIATLTQKDSSLEMEVTIEKGVGFVPAEEMKDGKEQVGQITIDAIFSPIRSVNFNVRNMRVGDRTDFDCLILQIETDGSISPEDAFCMSSETLVEHFNIFKSPFIEEKPKEKETKKEKKLKETKKEEKIEKKLEEKDQFADYDFSEKLKESFKKEKITLEDLKKMTEEELINIKGVGEKTAEKIFKSVKGK